MGMGMGMEMGVGKKNQENQENRVILVGLEKIRMQMDGA